MKKMTFLAALLGVTHFSNSQVGIGTATPADAAQLEISAINKGVLIPRVELRNTTTFGPVTGSEIESLLVYNTQTAADVTPGFYYWVSAQTTPAVPAHWERIVNQTQLNEAIGDITDLQGDLTKIKELLNYVYPSNNLGDSTLTDGSQGGGMIYSPASGTDPAKIEYVYFNGTSYIKQDLTNILNDIISPEEGNVIYNSTTEIFQYWDGTQYVNIDLADLVQANETKTKVVTIQNKQFYLAEDFTGTVPPTIPATLPTGMYAIDVVGGVINNIEEIFTTTTTIVINEGETNEQTFTTVEEYIKYISENAMQNGVTRIVIDTTTSQASFETWNGTTWSPVATAAFSNIVKQNQSLTDIATTNVNNVIQYVYTAEPNLDGTARTFTLDLTSDLISLINNNTNVRNAITNLTNDGVYYNGTGDNLTVGTTVIPAGSLYIIDNDGNGVLIDLGDIVVNEVVENFNTIVNRSVTVDGDTFNTVKEYIQYLSETSDANVGYTVDGIDAVDNDGVDIPANSFYYIDKLTGNKVAINFEAIVKANETETTIGKSADNSAYVQVTADPKAVDKIVYEYVTENETVKNYMDITADVEWSIINNEDVRNAITNVLNQGGNVYFTRTPIAAGTPTGQEAIPAFSFYTVNETGVKELVDIAQTIVNAITNATNVQKQEIKNQLGDNFENTTVVNTGDTWIDGGKIYRGIFDATVTGGSANVSAITLTGGTIGNVIGIKILNATTNQIINTATTDVAVTTGSLTFRIGTGNMYNVLSDSNLAIKVIVEYSVTTP